MNVYVETNFVLEHALEQEQCESCEELIRLASAGSIRLLVPAFSLAEPHIALTHKGKARSRLIEKLENHLSELGRSRPFREAPDKFSDLTALLSGSAKRERAGLQRAIDEMLKVAEVIPLDSDVLGYADGMRFVRGMSAQDSIVLASIVLHLAKAESVESCFLNRNSKDFDDPNVRGLLDGFHCRFFARFDDGLRYIEAHLRKEGS
jgi:hypothetical protein